MSRRQTGKLSPEDTRCQYKVHTFRWSLASSLTLPRKLTHPDLSLGGHRPLAFVKTVCTELLLQLATASHSSTQRQRDGKWGLGSLLPGKVEPVYPWPRKPWLRQPQQSLPRYVQLEPFILLSLAIWIENWFFILSKIMLRSKDPTFPLSPPPHSQGYRSSSLFCPKQRGCAVFVGCAQFAEWLFTAGYFNLFQYSPINLSTVTSYFQTDL